MTRLEHFLPKELIQGILTAWAVYKTQAGTEAKELGAEAIQKIKQGFFKQDVCNRQTCTPVLSHSSEMCFMDSI